MTRQHELNPAAAGLPGRVTRVQGPVTSFNSTRASIPLRPGLTYLWTSRNARKGRHSLQVSRHHRLPHDAPPPDSKHARSVVQGLGRMLTTFPIWDLSYLIAVAFTLGSVVWVINAFFAFLPLLSPDTAFPGESLDGAGITAFIGATIFELGSCLGMLEAVNEDRSGCFGWHFQHLFQTTSSAPPVDARSITRRESPRLQDPAAQNPGETTPSTQLPAHDVEKASAISAQPICGQCPHHDAHHNHIRQRLSASDPDSSRAWVWWPSCLELRHHYAHELGFWANALQLVAATIFWISGFTALPGIYENMSRRLIDGVYWVPQVVGGVGFILSGGIFMLENQPTWYSPAPALLGWHIGLWNLVGGIGFTLCPIFGFYPESWGLYQASCSTFWGSWAFLIGSLLQWYESLAQHPVEYV